MHEVRCGATRYLAHSFHFIPNQVSLAAFIHKQRSSLISKSHVCVCVLLMLRLEEVSSSHNYKMKMEIDEEERRFEKK